jgi:hypothetical protein
MDSILVVCYSYTGAARRLAQLLCSHHGWPLGEVVEERPRGGGAGTLRCVLDSLLRRHPAVRYQGPDPEDFHTVVLVAPVWMHRLAGPMRSFVAANRETLRRVAVLLTTGAGGASNAVAEIAQVLGHPPILARAFTLQEIEGGSGTGRLLDFADELVPPSTKKQATLQPAH